MSVEIGCVCCICFLLLSGVIFFMPMSLVAFGGYPYPGTFSFVCNCGRDGCSVVLVICLLSALAAMAGQGIFSVPVWS